MSNKKLKKEEGQQSLDSLSKSHQTPKATGNFNLTTEENSLTVKGMPLATSTPTNSNTTKKRPRLSPQSPERKKHHFESDDHSRDEISRMTTGSNTQISSPTKSPKKTEPLIKPIKNDERFKDFTSEFVAFGQLMSDKLNEIVEPLKATSEELCRDIRSLMEDKDAQKNAVKICEEVQQEQHKVVRRVDKVESENKELKSRLSKLENLLLERNLIFHGIKEEEWDSDEEATKERIWRAIANTVDDKDSR